MPVSFCLAFSFLAISSRFLLFSLKESPSGAISRSCQQ